MRAPKTAGRKTGNGETASKCELPCAICKKKFKTDFSLIRHENKCQFENLECYMCNTKFGDSDQLKDHVSKVHKGKVFVCPEDKCYFMFSTSKGLVYHAATHRSVECEVCECTFGTVEELNAHKKSREHKVNTSKTDCPGCKRQFSGLHEATRHFNQSCPYNENRHVKCNSCKVKVCASKLLDHLKEEHGCTNKFLCTRCLLDLTTSKQLSNHLKKCCV